MELTGAQILMECLVEQGVDTIFGYPGGQIITIYDELYRNSSRITHILSAHEQGAAHAADGYARATGKVGVCFATSGPGATNLVTGIATANSDSTPMVFITGNVRTAVLGTDAFQEVDITGITMPITKNNYIVKDVRELANVLRDAFHIAREGRPGAVLVDIPADIQLAVCKFTPMPGGQSKKPAPGQLALDYAQRRKAKLEKAADLIRASRRPLVLIGGGARGADAQVLSFIEAIGSPACETLMGRSTIPSSHPLHIGNVGMHGTLLANNAVVGADLIIALGTRFSDRINGGQNAFSQDSKLLQIDIDRAEINKNMPTAHYLVGDVAVVLEALLPLLGKIDKEHNALWTRQLDMPKTEPVPEDAWTPENIIGRLRETLGSEGIVATDVGQHQMWTSQYYDFETPRSFITSGGQGTMGFGLGAALGAKIGRPETNVALVTGDGCLRMNLNEFAMAGAYGVKIIVLLLNNGVLGMVRQWQSLMYGGRYSQTVLNRPPDFIKVAEAYGLAGHKAENLAELDAALKAAMEADTTTLIDCRIDADEMVRPMANPGHAINEFLLD